LGRWDDQKYVEQVNREYREDERADTVSDDLANFTAAVTSACLTLEIAQDAETLRNVWSGLRRDVQADAAVIKAKDARKAELMKVAA
jgi:hypothetical protein